MCFTLCMYTVTPAMAENNTNEEQIDQLLDKLAENQALSLLNENSENNQELQNENLQIESELSDLGVQKLDGEELLQFFEERGIPVTKGCQDCFYYEGCKDCALYNTEHCCNQDDKDN